MCLHALVFVAGGNYAGTPINIKLTPHRLLRMHRSHVDGKSLCRALRRPDEKAKGEL